LTSYDSLEANFNNQADAVENPKLQ